MLVGLLFHGIHAQENALQFHIQFGNAPLELGEKYISKNDTLQIEALKFYVSNIEIQYADASVYKPKNDYHLIDIEDLNTLKIPISESKKTIKKITFNIGVDSLASVSGALGGDLDPAKGMYWAWQSGYINMKIEGKSKSCKTRKNEFQFHIGGYLQPNYAMRKIELDTADTNVIVDLAELFSNIRLANSNSIMIPGKQAMAIADYSVKMFKTK
jgi:hypothetical protein